jgi:hypothetical protein
MPVSNNMVIFTNSPLVKKIREGIRFFSDIFSAEILGTTNRGGSTEITTYVKTIFNSELSANIVDVCPVGALTLKPYSFNTRSWELNSVTTIDLHDSCGVNLRVDLKESEIVRILPRESNTINDDWISDKTRFFYDGLKTKRLKKSLIKTGLSRYNFFDWKHVINLLSFFFYSLPKIRNNTSFFYDIFFNLENIGRLKILSNLCGISNVSLGTSVKLVNDDLTSFIFNVKLLLESNLCFLLGINTRFESSSIHLKIRKRYKQGLFNIFCLGSTHELMLPTYFFCVGNYKLNQIFSGKNLLSKRLKNITKIFLVFGNSLTSRADSIFLQNFLNNNLKLFGKLHICISFLSSTPNIMGSLLVNTGSFYKSSKFINYISGFDLQKDLDNVIRKVNVLSILRSSIRHNFGIYDLILCSNNKMEESGCFVNSFGLKQKNFSVVAGPQMARKFSILDDFFLKSLISTDSKIYDKNLLFPLKIFPLKTFFKYMNVRLSKTIFVANLNNFYISTTSDLLSKTLFKCSSTYKKRFQNFI